MKLGLTTAGLIGAAILLVNSALLAAFPTESLFEVVNVLLHIGLGAAYGIVALLLSRTDRRQVSIIIAALSGVLLAFMGNTRDHRVVFIAHVVLSLAAVAVIFARRQSFTIAKIASAAAAIVLIAGLI